MECYRAYQVARGASRSLSGASRSPPRRVRGPGASERRAGSGPAQNKRISRTRSEARAIHAQPVLAALLGARRNARAVGARVARHAGAAARAVAEARAVVRRNARVALALAAQAIDGLRSRSPAQRHEP